MRGFFSVSSRLFVVCIYNVLVNSRLVGSNIYNWKSNVSTNTFFLRRKTYVLFIHFILHLNSISELFWISMKNLWMKTLVKNTFNHLRLSSSPLYQLKALTYLDALSPLHNGSYTAFIVKEWLWSCTKFSNFNYSTLHNKRKITKLKVNEDITLINYTIRNYIYTR